MLQTENEKKTSKHNQRSNAKTGKSTTDHNHEKSLSSEIDKNVKEKGKIYSQKGIIGKHLDVEVLVDETMVLLRNILRSTD